MQLFILFLLLIVVMFLSVVRSHWRLILLNTRLALTGLFILFMLVPQAPSTYQVARVSPESEQEQVKTSCSLKKDIFVYTWCVFFSRSFRCNPFFFLQFYQTIIEQHSKILTCETTYRVRRVQIKPSLFCIVIMSDHGTTTPNSFLQN